ncbi:unnamed protein product [Cuscuta campestris]|uniref:Reverse transcriptase domain-containing protein n=1 Tax=Cuscuta campestris TaxID=132261 RepID=A0A484NLR9_9ASTE|nr:unnamed protein product [Cuscuta campestris]
MIPRFTQPRDAPHIHHLAYADDVVIFTSARGDTLERVRDVLHGYEQMSGQAISFPKSAFYMHPRAQAQVLDRVRDILGCAQDVLPFTYLGCPIYHGRKRIHYFEPLLKKMRDKCSAWMGRYLSPGGKAIMIKSVLQAIPTHLFAAHFPPKLVIREMEAIMTRFFWSGMGGERRYHWGSWKTLALPWGEGGVGFLDLTTLAKACSAKLWWNFRTQNTMWTAVKRRTYASAVKDARRCSRIEDLSTRGAHGKCVCVVPSSNQCPRREAGWGPARFLSPASVLAREIYGFRLGLGYYGLALGRGCWAGLLGGLVALGLDSGRLHCVRPPDTHQSLPDVETIPKHPWIVAVAAGNCQVDPHAAAQVSHFVPATTCSGKPPNQSTKVPDVLASSTPPESQQLDVGNARSPALPAPPFTIGSFHFPATSGEPKVAQPLSNIPGTATNVPGPSISAIEAGLNKPQESEVRVFPNTNSSIRRVQGQIGQKGFHIRDPHEKPVRMTLAPSVLAPADFPATVAGAPATAAAAQTTGKIPENSTQPPFSRKPVPSLSQVISASKRNSLPTFVTEPFPEREVTVHRGMPAVRFNEAEVSDLALIDKYILVGKFSHRQPKLEVKSGKGSRPPTSEELKLIETSDEPDEPAEDLEFDASALPFASTDIDLGRKREKTPFTPAARTPLICTLNRSANTTPSNRDFYARPSYCQDPGPSYEDPHDIRYHCDGRRYGEDSYPPSDEDEDDLIWEEEQEDIRYDFGPKSNVGYYGPNLEPFQRDLEAAGLSPPRNFRKTRSRYRDFEERFLG